MSVASPPVERITIPSGPIWRLSVGQYHRMIRSGILTADDPVELLEGVLVPKMTKSPRHRACTRRVRVALEGLVPAGWYVDAQEPITLADSEPEPDVSVTRVDTSVTVDRHPGESEIGLVVEVADTTLAGDRTTKSLSKNQSGDLRSAVSAGSETRAEQASWIGSKSRIYARARVPCYWVVDLIHNQVEVYSDAAVADNVAEFRSRAVFGLDDVIPLVIDGREVGRLAVRNLIPPGGETDETR